MLNQFSRTQLLLGQDGMERLYNARVAVFGIGGVGGYTVEALVRSGVGTLDLIDDDRVCLTNVNRQIFATRKTVGQYKADVAEERIKEINPNAVVHTYSRPISSRWPTARTNRPATSAPACGAATFTARPRSSAATKSRWVITLTT